MNYFNYIITLHVLFILVTHGPPKLIFGSIVIQENIRRIDYMGIQVKAQFGRVLRLEQKLFQ